MDIQHTVVKAMMNVFSALIIDDYCPKLEFEDGSLTLWTEDASCEAVLVVNRSRSLFGERVFSLEVVPGEGERYLAEMVADEVVEVVERSANDE